MKNLVVVFVAILLCIFFVAESQGEEVQAKSKSFEFTGTIMAKFENPERIIVESQGNPMEFHFAHDAKKQCISWQDLVIGEYVEVVYKEKKDHREATCISKKPRGTTIQGVKIGGGVTIK